MVYEGTKPTASESNGDEIKTGPVFIACFKSVRGLRSTFSLTHRAS